MTVAVEVFHWAFWEPTLTPEQMIDTIPPGLLTLWLPIAMLISLALLFLGQLTFRRLAIHFAQEL
jgi:ABC-2 type transport system permease protein